MTTSNKAKAEAEAEETQSENGASEDEPILDLEELVPKRPSVLFRTEQERKEGKEGKLYEVRTPGEFGVEEEHRYRSEWQEYNELMQKRELNKAERARLVLRLHNLFDKVLIAPSEVKERFSDRQRQQVMRLFTTALLHEDATAIENALPPMVKAQMARELASTTGT